MSGHFASTSMPERIVKLEVQVKHLADSGADVEVRLRRIERNLNLGLGALGLLQIVLNFFF
jgi:hypothetical protein